MGNAQATRQLEHVRCDAQQATSVARANVLEGGGLMRFCGGSPGPDLIHRVLVSCGKQHGGLEKGTQVSLFACA